LIKRLPQLILGDIIAHMMLTRTRLRTRLLAEQAQATLADLSTAAEGFNALAVDVPMEDLAQAITAVRKAGRDHSYAASRAAAAADDISLTIACVGAALIVFFAVGVWRATRD
jgi:hypothetical protein